MKIIKETKNKENVEFKFDNGAWVSIDSDTWECQSDEDDDESYCSGGLWFEEKDLVDYDGCFELPKEVKIALIHLGYNLQETTI